MSKNIVIFCDGTGNRHDAMENGRPAATNVYKLYSALKDYVDSDWTQVTWYDAGVGTGTSGQSRTASGIRRVAEMISARTPAFLAKSYEKLRVLLEAATGAGILENVVQGYAQIVHHYRPGDCIYLFGFSRGAYTVRCIAGVIARCGLLRPEHIRFAPDIVQLYRYRDLRPNVQPDQQVPPVDQNSHLFHPHGTVTIRFMGVWDTVASLGLPLWGWWFRIGKLWSNSALDTNPAAICERICHAVSMDERRSQFFVTLFNEDRKTFHIARKAGQVPFEQQRLEQVWFRGSHAGVGGGYVDTDLSDIALRWMVDHAFAAGVRLHKGALRSLMPDPLGQVHNQLQRQKAWYLFGTWPRWHPCPRPDEAAGSDGSGMLHKSVYERAALARERREQREQAAIDSSHRLASARQQASIGPSAIPPPPVKLPLDPEEMHFLDVGGSARVLVRADRQWNRTGLVIEAGASYLIRLASGAVNAWRDKECPICGPGGQDAGWDVRRLFGWMKRVRDAKWLELIGTVAHPRDWPLREEGLGKLLKYLLVRDPRELTRTLAPLGRHLEKSGDAVFLRSEAPSGMFYCFANDVWLTYANNTGSIELDITRIGPSELPGTGPVITISPDGGVSLSQ